LIILFTIVLTSCATSSDLRSKPPTLELVSSKSSKAVAGCIGDGLDTLGLSLGNYNVLSSRPTANGYSMSLHSKIGGWGSETSLVIDISETQDGSKTFFFSNLLQRWEKRIIPVVKNCQGSTFSKTTILDAPKSESSSTINSSIPQKLRALQVLRKEGVITEEDFQKKKKQLLEKL